MSRTLPFISIVGTTATGKTDLALAVAQAVTQSTFPRRFERCVLISADSRQVYQGIAYLTGADIPEGFTQVNDLKRGPLPFWENAAGTIELHGVSCIEPTEPWSAAHFTEFSRKLLQRAESDNILPVVVGGTGFYHQQLLAPAPTQGIAPNQELRVQSQQLAVSELQKRLVALAPATFSAMNNSDAHNKRRLVRAIEVATAEKNTPEVSDPAAALTERDHLTVGLTDSPENLTQRIKQRVASRLGQAVFDEVAAFIQLYPQRPEPAWTATGLTQIEQYLEGGLSKEACIAAWTLREVQYAKRQLVWWKKRENITWYTVGESNARDRALHMILEWLQQ